MPSANVGDSSHSEMSPKRASKTRPNNYLAGLLICFLVVLVILLRGSLTRQCGQLHGLTSQLHATLPDGSKTRPELTVLQAGPAIDVSYKLLRSRVKRGLPPGKPVNNIRHKELGADGFIREKRDVEDDTNSTLMSSIASNGDHTIAPVSPVATVTPMAEPDETFIPSTPTQDGDTTLAYAGGDEGGETSSNLGLNVGLPLAIVLLILLLVAILLLYRYRPQKFNNLKFIPIKRKGTYDFHEGITRQPSVPPEIIHTVDIGRRGSEYVLNLVPEGLIYKALYEFKAEDENQLSLHADMEVEVLEKTNSGWWKGCTSDESGWFPSSYVEPVKRGAANMGYTPDHGMPRAARSMSMGESIREKPNFAEIETKPEEPATLANVDQKDLSRVLATLRLQSLREIGVSPDILQKAYRVTCIYKPNAADELQVSPGELLLHLNRDPNGWVKVRKKDTGEEGWVPLACLTAVEEEEEVGSKPLLSKQVSAPANVEMRSESQASTTPGTEGPDSPLSPELTGLQYRAECAYDSNVEGHLKFATGDYIVVLETHENGWWRGCTDGCEGWFPGSYVKMVAASPGAEDSGCAVSLSTVPPPDMFADVRKDLSTVFEEDSSPDELDSRHSHYLGGRLPVEGQESNATSATIHAQDSSRPELPKRFVKPKLVKVRTSALKHRSAIERPKVAAPPPPPRPPGPVKLLKPKSKLGKRHTLPDIRDASSVEVSDGSPITDQTNSDVHIQVTTDKARPESCTDIQDTVVVFSKGSNAEEVEAKVGKAEETEEPELPTPGLSDSIILPDEDAMNQYLAKQFDILLESTSNLSELKCLSSNPDGCIINSGDHQRDVSSSIPLIASSSADQRVESSLNPAFDSRELKTPEGVQLRAATEHTPTPYSLYHRQSGCGDYTGSDAERSLERRPLPRAPPRRSIPVAAVKPVCQDETSHYDNLSPHFNKQPTSDNRQFMTDSKPGSKAKHGNVQYDRKLDNLSVESELNKLSETGVSNDRKKLSKPSDMNEDTYDVILGPVSDLIDEIGRSVELHGLTSNQPSCSSDVSQSGSDRSSGHMPKKSQSLSRTSSGRSSSSRTFSRSSSGRSSGCQRPTVPPPPPPTSTSIRPSVTSSVSQPSISTSDKSDPHKRTEVSTVPDSATKLPHLRAGADTSSQRSSALSTPHSSRGSSPPPLPEAPPPSLLPPSSIFDDDDEDLLSSITKYLSPSSQLVDSEQSSHSPSLIGPDSRSTPSPILNIGANIFKISMFEDDSPAQNQHCADDSTVKTDSDLAEVHCRRVSSDQDCVPLSSSLFTPIDSPGRDVSKSAPSDAEERQIRNDTNVHGMACQVVPSSKRLSNTFSGGTSSATPPSAFTMNEPTFVRTLSSSKVALPSPTSDDDPFTSSIAVRSPSEESIEVKVLTRGRSPPRKPARKQTTSPPLPPKPDYEVRKAILSRRSPTKSPREKSPPPIAPKPDLKKLRRKSAPPEPSHHWFWGSKSGKTAKEGSSMWVRNAARRSDGGIDFEGPPQCAPPPKPSEPKYSLGGRSPPIPENSMKRAITDGNLSFDTISLKRATQSYFGTDEGELSFAENSFIKDLGEVVDRPGWMIGELLDGTTGMYPQSHVCDMSIHTDEDESCA